MWVEKYKGRQARDKPQNQLQIYHNPKPVTSPPRPRAVTRPLTLVRKPLTRGIRVATKLMTMGMRDISKNMSKGLNTSTFSLPEAN
jgi:hypothetical protein